MGYYIYLVDSEISLKEGSESAALAALTSLDPNMGGGGVWHPDGTVEKWFSWVSNDFKNSKTLTECAMYWRYDLDLEKNSVQFFGEKRGDDEIFWSTLAPFMENGSYLEWHGEDGAQWRWVFQDGEMNTFEMVPSWIKVES